MTAEPLRLAFRQQVRVSALDQARRLTAELGWERVRLSQIAVLAGVSRPTLYKEFGDKRGLGEALVRQETERFLDGVQQCLAAAGDNLRAAVAAAARFTFEEAERSPVLHAALTTTGDRDDGLLPLLTTRSAPLLESASAAVLTWLREQLPQLGERELTETADALVRLVVSHLVQPGDAADATADRLARLTLRLLGVPEQPLG